MPERFLVEAVNDALHVEMERDADVMEKVVDFVFTQEAEGPADMETDEKWRRSLMTVGHDPTRP